MESKGGQGIKRKGVKRKRGQGKGVKYHIDCGMKEAMVREKGSSIILTAE